MSKDSLIVPSGSLNQLITFGIFSLAAKSAKFA